MPSGLFGKPAVRDQSRRSSSSPCARCSAVSVALFASSSHLAAIEIVALCVSSDRLVVEGDVVVRVLPARRRRRRAALGVDARCSRFSASIRPCAHLRIVDQQLAVVVDQLDVVGVHEGQERVERVARIDAHRLADARRCACRSSGGRPAAPCRTRSPSSPSSRSGCRSP